MCRSFIYKSSSPNPARQVWRSTFSTSGPGFPVERFEFKWHRNKISQSRLHSDHTSFDDSFTLIFHLRAGSLFTSIVEVLKKKSQAIKKRTCQCGPYVLKLELLNTVRTLGPSFKNRNNMLSLVTGVEKHTFPSSYHFLSTTWQSTDQEL